MRTTGFIAVECAGDRISNIARQLRWTVLRRVAINIDRLLSSNYNFWIDSPGSVRCNDILSFVVWILWVAVINDITPAHRDMIPVTPIAITIWFDTVCFEIKHTAVANFVAANAV